MRTTGFYRRRDEIQGHWKICERCGRTAMAVTFGKHAQSSPLGPPTVTVLKVEVPEGAIKVKGARHTLRGPDPTWLVPRRRGRGVSALVKGVSGQRQ